MLRAAITRLAVNLGLATCLLTAPGWAQLSKPSTEELSRVGNGPGPVPGSVTAASLIKLSDMPPTADPRDFAGVWRIYRAPGQSVAAAALAGRPPPTGNRAAPGRLPEGILCLPMPGTTVGVDGPLMIIQSPEIIIWQAEQGHVVRRIYMNAEFTPSFTANHLGEAVARFDGDTLVVETRGLKRLPAGAKMLERWTKSAEGRQVDMTLEEFNAAGQPLGATRRQSITWRPGESLMEWMCEDYNDEWLPGGADFEDQVGR